MTEDKATFIVLWQPRNTAGIMPIGPFDHFDEAETWKIENLSLVPEDRVQVRRLIYPSMESIAMPTNPVFATARDLDACLDMTALPAFLKRQIKDKFDDDSGPQ